MKKEKEVTCKDCLYSTSKYSSFMCRRYPPLASYRSAGSNYGQFILVSKSEDWCGEFKQKKTKNDWIEHKGLESPVNGE